MFRTVAKWLRQLSVALLIFLGTTYGVLVAGSLPRTVKVYVVGTEPAKPLDRLDTGGSAGLGGGMVEGLLLTRSIEGEILRFQNRNTNWGWPPYFKFNASELSRQAHALALEEPSALVEVRYYGFRLGLSAAYPNALGMSPARPGPLPEPYLGWVVLAIHLLGAVVVGGVCRRRRVQRFKPQACVPVSSPQ